MLIKGATSAVVKVENGVPIVKRRRLNAVWLCLAALLALVACGQNDDAAGSADRPTATTASDVATATNEPSPQSTATPGPPTQPVATATKDATLPVPPTATVPEQPEVSPTAPWVDTAPLDDPELGIDIYWLGERFEPGGNLPPLVLSWVLGIPGGGPLGMRAQLDYPTEPLEPGGVGLRLMSQADWDAQLALDPATDDFGFIAHMFWDSPCAQQERLDLDGGHAIVYSSYQSLADRSVSTCPTGPFDRFLAHVFMGDTVILVNAPILLENTDGMPDRGPYNSQEGMRQVVSALRLREPVVEPTPIPTPAASVDDPSSLVLQPADLPGRYGYGDDGCSPRYDCNFGPIGFGSEGGYEELSRSGGRFLAFYYQYEHVGFNAAGEPHPNIEPPVIDSFALVCLEQCDPAALLALGPELVRYQGGDNATTLDGAPSLGDETHLYRVDTLVVGQVEPGIAVLWRRGPVVGLIIVGGAGEDAGRQLAVDLAMRQDERIALALGP